MISSTKSLKTTTPTGTSPTRPDFSLACALLGFHPHRLPDEKIIKQRYKQLSKIYHPDLQGSEEEMKRLNGAMKIINQRLTKR
ncbi:DnaJ domain-containing protein [Vibrio metschnikovii]